MNPHPVWLDLRKERHMRRITTALVLFVVCWALSPGAGSTAAALANDGNKKQVAMRDDCDPDTWPGPPPGGGCELEDGDVSRAEFDAESDLTSGPLAASVIGHQAWRNDPPYLKIKEGETVKVKNRGGRGHTFTKVANFGGGRVPPLNKGLLPAMECQDPATSPVVAPGGRTEVAGLSAGNHRFQCCLHPWMRMLVKVKPDHGDDEEEDEDN
jgi:plastocyanin